MNMLTVPNYNRFGQMVDELFESAKSERSGFSPACEIKTSTDFYTISFEIPGVEASNVDIEVLNDCLVVRGKKEGQANTESSTSVLNERNFGAFQRSFSLPEDVNAEAIKAKCKNGVLTLMLSKNTAVEPKKIKIDIEES